MTTAIKNVIELKVPDIGGSSDVNVAEIYIKAGDNINVDDNLIMLETDKATMEVPATNAGVVQQVIVKVGDKINEGSVIALLTIANNVDNTDNKNNKTDAKDNSGANKNNASSNHNVLDNDGNIGNIDHNNKVETITIANDASITDEQGFANAFASPSIRKLARELGVDLTNIQGSGAKGRITESDLKDHVKQMMRAINGGIMPNSCVGLNGANNNSIGGINLLPWPVVDFAKFGSISKVPLSRIKKLSGANLARNWVMIPHVTQFDEANISELEEFRKSLNNEGHALDGQVVKITPLAFLIKACVYALKQFPEFNASLEGDELIYKHYYHIGFAADTKNGLVVPVLKDADSKGILSIAKETSMLALLAREGKLKPTDMQGGTFTISSLGGIGGRAFTPIINAPEVAILGISKATMQPIWQEQTKSFVPRLMLPLSLSYDHRIIDGALAARFTNYLAQVLGDIRRLML